MPHPLPMTVVSRFARTVVSLSGALLVVTASAQPVADTAPALEMRGLVATKPLVMNRLGAMADRRGRQLAVTRLDLILSGLSLQRSDGTWTSGAGWHGFFRAEQPTRRQSLPSVSPGRY